MTQLIAIIICAIIMAVIIIGSIVCYIQERRDFNKGICRYCGKPLVHFDDDSQGGQGWCCHDCMNYVWISWFNGEAVTRDNDKRKQSTNNTTITMKHTTNEKRY